MLDYRNKCVHCKNKIQRQTPNIMTYREMEQEIKDNPQRVELDDN